MSIIAKTLKSSDGTEIYADATGNPKNQSIVFLHGMSMCSGAFDNLFANKKLLDKFYLVRYDIRGHGRSGTPKTDQGHASSLYANDFAAVVRGFGLKKPFFVGWSVGAAVIADICINIRPLPIAGAIALNGPPLFHPKVLPITLSATTLACRPGLVSSTDVSLALSARRDFVQGCFRDAERVPFSLKASWIGYSAFLTPDQATQTSLRFQDTAKLLRMKKGELRLLMLCGSEDKLVNGVTLAKDLQAEKYFGDVEVELNVVPGGSHALFIDNEEETVDALMEFFESVKKT